MARPERRAPPGPSRSAPARKQVSFNSRIAQRSAQKPPQKNLWDGLESPQQDDTSPSPDSPLFPEIEQESFHTRQQIQHEQSKIDRIGDEAEAFAVRLAEWQDRRDVIEEGDPQSETKRIKEANQLLDELQEIARETYEVSKRDYTYREPLSKTWRGKIAALQDNLSPESDSMAGESTAAADDNLEELRDMKAEVDTWELFRKLTAIQSSKLSPEHREHFEQEHPIDEYSPDADLWTRFILFDDTARERKVVLEWLEHTAQTSETTFDAIVQQMESRTGTGNGTWSHGWLHTREKIKGEKRLRSITGATSIQQAAQRASNSAEVLVTQLDPDAPTRQKRSLEKQDDHYERSIWLACYEMLRRGMPWGEIREWFEDRNEGWRGASLGAAQDLDRKSSRLCLAGPHAGALWRRMCLLASRQTSAEKYERAVYGLLAGDTESVEPVCRAWEDLVYVKYNSLLLGSFEAWLQDKYPSKFPSVLAQKFPIYEPVQAYENAEDYRQQLLGDILQRPMFTKESHKPNNWIQAILISGSFETLVNDLGITLARKAADSGSKLILRPTIEEEPLNDYTDFSAKWDALRIVVHMIIIFKEVGMQFDPSVESKVTNIFGGYIDVLRLLGKIEAIPTYARFIGNPYQTQLLAMVLFEVTDRGEQNRLVELLGENRLAVVDILKDQFAIGLHRLDLSPGSTLESIGRFKLIEESLPRWAGFRIQPGFMVSLPGQLNRTDGSPYISKDEARLVRGTEWFFKCNSTWHDTFYALTKVQMQLFRTGRHDAALAVARAVPFRSISMQKSVVHFGQPVDVFDDIELRSGEDETNVGYKVKLLRQQSRTYMELEQLCVVIETLARWRDLENGMEGLAVTLLNTKAHRKDMRDGFTILSRNVHPLLQDWLTHIPEEEWVEDIKAIRRAYLPEIILAYIGILTLSAEFVGSEPLLRVFDLANMIANDLNSELQQTFLDADRMDDLVTAFALSSRRLLSVNQNMETFARRAKKEAEANRGVKGVDAEAIREKDKYVRKKEAKAKEELSRRKDWVGETMAIWDPLRSAFAEGA